METAKTHQKQQMRKTNSYPGTESVLLAIPVFNEYKYIDTIIKAVRRFASNILVIDDGSSDGTSALLSRYDFLTILSHKTNMGYGQSLINAFNFAHQNSFDWLISIDCDCQHEPSYIPHFYVEIKNRSADIISGSRYLQAVNSGSIKPPRERVIINKKITHILNSKLGVQLTDAFCGFKAYKVKSISRLKLSEKGYGFCLQLLVQAIRSGLKVREIPVPLIYHNSNRSFYGRLKNPRTRFNYYKAIIQQEFEKDGYKNTSSVNHS